MAIINTSRQRKGRNYFSWRILGPVLLPPCLVLIVEVFQITGWISRKNAIILSLLALFIGAIFIRLSLKRRFYLGRQATYYRRLLALCGLISLSLDEQRKWLRNIVTGLAADAQRGLKSKYFIRSNDGRDVTGRQKLFDTDRMIEDLSAQFPSLPKEDVKREVIQIHYYLLR